MKIIIIDTACANLASLKFCLDRLGFNATISRDLKELESADKLFTWSGYRKRSNEKFRTI